MESFMKFRILNHSKNTNGMIVALNTDSYRAQKGIDY